MKTRTKISLAGLVGLILLAVVIAFLGGVHRSVFIRFGPVGEAELQTDFNFVPHFSVTHFGSQYVKTLIPFFLYSHGREDGESYVTIQTEHENDPYYGYDTLSHLKVTDLTVFSGETKESLIAEDDPVEVYLNTERWASRLQKLGSVEGDEVEISVTGIAYTQDGSSHEFKHKQKWRKVRSSRWDTGLGMMP